MFLLFLSIECTSVCFPAHSSHVRQPITFWFSAHIVQCMRHFGVTSRLFVDQKFSATENFTPIVLDRSKKKTKMQGVPAALKKHMVDVDVTGYEYDADTDLLFKSKVTGVEDERGDIIDLQDETDEEKRRIIQQFYPQDVLAESNLTDRKEDFLEPRVRPSVPEYFREIFNHQDYAPYHAVGLLRMHYSRHGHVLGDFRYIGSAFLIDRDVLLTAGHNILPSEFKIQDSDGQRIVIHNQQKQEPDVIKFYRFCVKGRGEPAQVKSRKVHPYWHANFRTGYDVGVLSLDHEFEPHQKLTMGKIGYPQLIDRDLEVFGYPAHIQRTQSSHPERNYPLSMFASYGRGLARSNPASNTKLHYNCLTYGGNSGSPVIATKTAQQPLERVSVAVHTNGHDRSNSGVHFTDEIEVFIQNAVRQFDESGIIKLDTDLKKDEIELMLKENQYLFSDPVYQFLQDHLEELVASMNLDKVDGFDQKLAYCIKFFRSKHKN